MSNHRHRRRRKWARKGAKGAAEEGVEMVGGSCCCLSEVFGVVAVVGAVATFGVRRRRRG